MCGYRRTTYVLTHVLYLNNALGEFRSDSLAATPFNLLICQYSRSGLPLVSSDRRVADVAEGRLFRVYQTAWTLKTRAEEQDNRSSVLLFSSRRPREAYSDPKLNHLS